MGNIPSGYTPRMELFVRRLARLRRERDWTQTELGKRAGVGQGKISEWERGLTPPPPKKPGSVPNIPSLQKLGRAFGMKWQTLIADTDLDDSDQGNAGGQIGTSPVNRGGYNHPSTKPEQGSDTGGAGDTEPSSAGEGERTELPAVTWKEPADQQRYGRDLRRAALFLSQLGSALITGQARIVEQARPGSRERRGSAGRGLPGVSGAKKSRAV